MKFSLVVINLFIGTVFFTGCGDNKSNRVDINGIQAVASHEVCNPSSINREDGLTYDIKYFINGDITVGCNSIGKKEYSEGYKLKNGVDSLIVTQLKKVESFSGTINGKKAFSIDTYDYKAGTIHHKESSQFGDYDCVETYSSPLPYTITNAFRIQELFDWDGGNENNKISTTCPQSYYDDIDDTKFILHVNGIINYTITDGDGKKHYVTDKISVNKN